MTGTILLRRAARLQQMLVPLAGEPQTHARHYSLQVCKQLVTNACRTQVLQPLALKVSVVAMSRAVSSPVLLLHRSLLIGVVNASLMHGPNE